MKIEEIIKKVNELDKTEKELSCINKQHSDLTEIEVQSLNVAMHYLRQYRSRIEDTEVEITT